MFAFSLRDNTEKCGRCSTGPIAFIIGISFACLDMTRARDLQTAERVVSRGVNSKSPISLSILSMCWHSWE